MTASRVEQPPLPASADPSARPGVSGKSYHPDDVKPEDEPHLQPPRSHSLRTCVVGSDSSNNNRFLTPYTTFEVMTPPSKQQYHNYDDIDLEMAGGGGGAEGSSGGGGPTTVRSTLSLPFSLTSALLHPCCCLHSSTCNEELIPSVACNPYTSSDSPAI